MQNDACGTLSCIIIFPVYDTQLTAECYLKAVRYQTGVTEKAPLINSRNAATTMQGAGSELHPKQMSRVQCRRRFGLHTSWDRIPGREQEYLYLFIPFTGAEK